MIALQSDELLETEDAQRLSLSGIFPACPGEVLFMFVSDMSQYFNRKG